MRVVSLIASSTETIYALGYGDCLVGRSHECDFPDEVVNVPVCTAAKFDLVGSSREIDQRVRATLSTQGSVYRTDTQLLEALEPDLIVTQDQCEICAVVLRDVEEATNRFSYGQPEIVSLAPGDLESVLSGIIEIAKGLGDPERGERLVDGMRARMDSVHSRLQESKRACPSVACIEWIDPLMIAGNWIPELVERAGGIDVLGPRSNHSSTIELSKLREADPDAVVVMLCGWDIEKTIEESEAMFRSEEAQCLRAVQEGCVYYTNGNHYFNRPGPRLADSVEILSEILHPDLFNFGYKDKAWVRRGDAI